MFSKRSNRYSFVLEEISISPIVIPLVGDVIISCDRLVTNGERETFATSEFLSKTRSSKRLCRGAMSREFDHNR